MPPISPQKRLQSPFSARLLLLSERFPPDIGGVARSAERTARAIGSLGVETHVLAWTKTLPPGQLETEPWADGVVLHRLGLFANWDLSMQHTSNVLEWLHDQQKFGVVWGHYLFPAGFLAVQFAETRSIPSIVSARGNDVDRATYPPGDFARLLWTLNRAGVVTAVSRDLARKIDVLLGRDAGVRVIHNSVDLDLFRPQPADEQLRRHLGIAPVERVLGFCGELRHKKGLPFLLSALDHVRQRQPACLLVIGEARAREQTLLSSFLAEHPDARQRVIVTGRLDSADRIARHLCLCDVFLQPSVWDGLPNALLEAMACGRVVVASDAGGIPEAIEHERSGLVIPRAHLHRLGDACLDVLALPERRKEEIGREARRRVAECFHPRREAEALAECLSSVMPGIRPDAGSANRST